jgi:hypothetical protein
MENYLITVDSSERNTNLYPTSQEYTIEFNKPLYDVKSINLTSARIPLSQYLIDAHNNVFVIDTVSYPLTNGNYETGTVLASQLQSDINASNVNTVSYSSTTNKLSFNGPNDYTFDFSNGNNPALVLGFDHVTYTSSSGDIEAPGVINIDGPDSLILSITGNSEDHLHTELYPQTPHEPIDFFGVLINKTDVGSKIINYDFSSDKVGRNFHDGPVTVLDHITVKFLQNNFDDINPYDFKLRNHVLKFEIRASMDKLAVTKENEKITKMIELPPILELERFKDQYRPFGDKRVLVYGGAVLVFIIFVVLLSSLSRGALRQTRAGRS